MDCSCDIADILPLVMLHTIALLLPILAPRLGFLRVMMKFFGP